MNWYKKAQQQYLWDNDPMLPYANMDIESRLTGSLKDDIGEAENIQQLNKILSHYGYTENNISELFFPKTNEKKLVLSDGNDVYLVDLSFPNPSFYNAREWIYDLGDNVWSYVEDKDFNKEFWDSVYNGYKMYHGTYLERIESIKANGLEPRNETRGIGNRSMGDGIFTSSSPETAYAHYPVVIEIDVGKMKGTGFMPNVGREEPIEEGEAYELLANKLGIQDFIYDYEQGIEFDTIVFYGKIPPKYLRILK